MKKKFFALMIVSAFVLNAAGVGSVAAFAETKSGAPTAAAKQTNELAAQLPMSDAVMTLNIQRLFSDALPLVLSGSRQSMLIEITGKIDEFKTKTGFDLRQFEQVAIGVSSKKIVSGGNVQELTFEPVMLARGSFNAGVLLALGKTAANGKYRQETIGERTIYIFSPQQIISSRQKFKTAPLPSQPKKPAAATTTTTTKKTPSPFERALDKMFDSLSREVAVTVFNDNTLAIGSPARVRETVGAASPKIGDDVLGLINRRANAVFNIGLKLPNGMADLVPNLGNDEISKNINAIRYLSGALDAADGNAVLSVAAKTSAPEQAKSIYEQLQGLQMLGKSFLGGGKSEDKQVYARMIDNVKIARGEGANEVTLDLQVPQSDISILLNPKKPLPKTSSK